MKAKTMQLIEQHSELITEALSSLRRELEASHQKVTEGAA